MNNFMSLFGLIGFLGTSIVSLWAIFRYVLLGTYRLNSDVSKRLIDRIKKDNAPKWILSEECVESPRYPNVFDSLAVLSGIPVLFSKSERLMTAGWKGKEELSTITFLRWHRKRLDTFLKIDLGGSTIPITALSVGSEDRLGELESGCIDKPYLNEGTYEDIEQDVKRVVEGVKNKTGFLLHGPPGNGKTQFVKYLSRKYRLPISVVYLRPDYDNYDIARMFSEVSGKCIVLLEDFDNYFNGRECLMKNDQVRFTFDSVINALDGVHNDYRGVVFAMTANNIDRIDDALKKRPSRFKFVRQFGSPDEGLRFRILQDVDAVKETEGFTLDEVFNAKRSS